MNTQLDSIKFFCDIKNINFIGKYENLLNDFNYLKSQIPNIKELPYINKNNNKEEYKYYYNEYTYNIITDIYKNDITYFNYKF